MKAKAKIILGITAVLLVVLAGAYFTNAFGIPANHIEREARKSRTIGDAWGVSQSINDGLCALIFYNETLDDYTYSIYINRDGLSFGYFFRMGGSSMEVEQGIQTFDFDIKGKAFISMNKAGIANITLDNDVSVTQIDVDPKKPFAVVVPVNCGEITFFDAGGEVVPVKH